jgi:hypothetical protein
MAFQEAGLGNGKKGVHDVPITETREEFTRKMEWEDLYVVKALRVKQERFLSLLEEGAIVTGVKMRGLEMTRGSS